MELLKSLNRLYLALLVFAIGIGIYYTYTIVPGTIEAYQKDSELTASLLTANQELETLKIEKQQREQAEKAALANGQGTDKVVYQAQGLSFGADASFAPLFEIVIEQAKGSGIRIRSIDYNYSPADDPIFSSKLAGYNVCELNLTAVGTYSQFQTFFKSVLREHYLTYLAEIEIKPWENDKSVLITNMKLRLYTKT